MSQTQIVSKNIKPRPYQKVSFSQKTKLIQSVFFQGLKVKEASLQLEINYAAAKTIINKARQIKLKTNQSIDRQSTPCGIKKVDKQINYKIISINQGKIVQSQEF